MELRVAIVDDLEADRTRLASDVRAALADRGIDGIVRRYANSEEMLAAYAPGSFDVAFLDICMEGGMNGIELASRLRELGGRLIIVFITTSPEFALDAYPTHPFDYLVKPYDPDRLEHLIDDVLSELGSDAHATVEFGVPYGSVSLALDEILSIEAHGHDIQVILAGGADLRSTTPYSDARELVASDSRFLEVNRGITANLDHAAAVDGDVVVMADGRRLPLRKRERSSLARAIMQHMISRVGRKRRG